MSPITKLGSDLNSALSKNDLQQSAARGQRSQSTSSSSELLVSSDHTQKSGSGLTVSISESALHLQQNVTNGLTSPSAGQTPEETASNILTPIKNRLEAARLNGASEQDLRSLLKEGYKGFKQGFREAFKTIEHTGNLDPTLKADLKETKHLVRLGFSALREEFAPKFNQDLVSRNTSVERININETSFNEAFAETNRAAKALTIEQTRSALIEVTTNDGDIVTVDIASIIQAKKEASSNGIGYTLDKTETSGYLVEGELDADELKALDTLLDQVDDLATQFFAGEVGAAFENSLIAGIDFSEIVSFSMALRESTSVNVASAYLNNDESIPSMQGSRQTSPQVGYQNLGEYVLELQRAVEAASAYSQPANLVSTLLSTQVELNKSGDTEIQTISPIDVQNFNRTNDALLGLLSTAG